MSYAFASMGSGGGSSDPMDMSDAELDALIASRFDEGAFFDLDTAIAWQWGDPLPQGLVDGVAGFGDALSFGGSKWVRGRMGIGGVDYSSGAYTGGQAGGVVYSIGLGGAAGLRLAGNAGRGMEFSHWIPTRMGGPRSLFNGNYVTSSRHALSDPYRYRFMPRSWKAQNPMPSAAVQQWNRVPMVYKGAAAGGAYGGGSVWWQN